MELNALERRALEISLSKSGSWYAEIRKQVPFLRVISRKHTGVGFYTLFSYDGAAPVGSNTPPGERSYAGAWATHPNVEGGARHATTFVVYVKDGFIVQLEGASTGTWPEDETLFDDFVSD